MWKVLWKKGAKETVHMWGHGMGLECEATKRGTYTVDLVVLTS